MALPQSVLLILLNDSDKMVSAADARSSGLARDANGREVVVGRQRRRELSRQLQPGWAVGLRRVVSRASC